MKTAIVIIGVPGSGKTTLMYELMRRIEREGTRGMPFRYGLLRGNSYGDMAVLGEYDPHPGASYAQGTDRLSMGVQPDFTKYTQSIGGASLRLLFEGDRLGNVKTLVQLVQRGYKVHLYHIHCDAGLLRQRYAARGSNQSETFLKGRKTKTDNVVAAGVKMKGVQVHCMYHQTQQDMNLVATSIMKKLT